MNGLTEYYPEGYYFSPLPAHEIPHESVACGDPEWCLHDPTPKATPRFEIDRITPSDKPGIFFDSPAPDLEIDAAAITEEMLKVGFDHETAHSFAVYVHSPDNLSNDTSGAFEKRWLDGWYRDAARLHLESERTLVGFYPVMHVVAKPTATPKELSRTVWHELGHAHDDIVNKNSKDALYNNERNIKLTKKLGITACGATLLEFGVGMFEATRDNAVGLSLFLGASALTAIGGLWASGYPEVLLWQLSSKERYARKFASKRQHLQVVGCKT